MKRLVVDASALISGVVSKPASPPALLLSAIHQGAFEPVVCPQLLTELHRALDRPKLRPHLAERTADEIVEGIARASIRFADPDTPEAILRDPNDDYLVALAHAAGAEAIVTGDLDLLDHPDLNPKAIKPREACQLLGLL